MGERTGIEWTGATWTPVRARHRVTGKVGWFCTHATPGCENCYAEGINIRLGTGLPFKPGHLSDVEVFLDVEMLLQPLRWSRSRTIFVCSMTDLFGDFVSDAMIDQVFAVMAMCPQHDFQVLTKRSARMRAWMASHQEAGAMSEMIATLYVDTPEIARQWPLTAERAMGIGERGWPLPNVWLGVSTEDQRRADERVPDLLAILAAIRFVSAEPLLGLINFNRIHQGGQTEGGGRWDSWESALNGKRFDIWSDGDVAGMPKLDWIIVGGESGPGARPMHPDWARSIRDQCEAVGVAFHFKQWGEFREFDTGSPAVEQVMAGGYHADSVLAAAVRPSWVTREGRHIRLESELPVEGEHGARLIERLGKKAAGRILDGVEHNGMPARASTARAA